MLQLTKLFLGNLTMFVHKRPDTYDSLRPQICIPKTKASVVVHGIQMNSAI
uniref:Uncharacterized protein n=1 Tax=Arundo donax TaxID=35708 RepID=A0A0A9A6V8_ARUDO